MCESCLSLPLGVAVSMESHPWLGLVDCVEVDGDPVNRYEHYCCVMPDALDPLCRPLGHGHGVPAGRAILRRVGIDIAQIARAVCVRAGELRRDFLAAQGPAQLRTPGSLVAASFLAAKVPLRNETARRPPRRTAAPCPASTSRRPCPILRHARRPAPRAVRSRRVAEGKLGIGPCAVSCWRKRWDSNPRRA